MIKTIKLGEIAEIQTGYSFREAIIDDESGVIVIQAKDIDGMYAKQDHLPRVNQDFSKSRLLNRGDVLLTSRGSFRSTVAKFDKPTVASSSLYSIRLKTNNYMPEFLAIYLNSGRAQSYLKQSAKGATIQSVNTQDLVNLPVPSISLEKQRLLVKIQQNIESQGSLLQAKLDTLNKIYIGAINKTLKGVAQ